MSEKSILEEVKNYLMQMPKVWMAFGLASNNLIYLLSNTTSHVGCFGSDNFGSILQIKLGISGTQTWFVCINV